MSDGLQSAQCSGLENAEENIFPANKVVFGKQVDNPRLTDIVKQDQKLPAALKPSREKGLQLQWGQDQPWLRHN